MSNAQMFLKEFGNNYIIFHFSCVRKKYLRLSSLCTHSSVVPTLLGGHAKCTLSPSKKMKLYVIRRIKNPLRVSFGTNCGQFWI